MNNPEEKSEIVNNLFIERPIHSSSEDVFELETRIVNKIYDFIKSSKIYPLALAITGEFGIGKSSAINLLRNKILKENEIRGGARSIVINFEPQLEGKFEINELIQSFYLKLHREINDSDIKSTIKKCFKSLLILGGVKLAGKFKVPSVAEINVEYNLDEKINKLFEIWEEAEPVSFIEQTEELNKKLKNGKYHLYIIIDEIDRLTAAHIINFLMFTRIIETFDNVTSIIGIDFDKALSKLIDERQIINGGYENARDYIDKLFQMKFPVYIDSDVKIKHARHCLHQVDDANILSSIIESSSWQEEQGLDGIISYLNTPRQIKKWLVAIKANINIIKHSSNPLALLKYLAVTIKHPVVTDNISRHTLQLLNNKYILSTYIEDQYGIDFTESRIGISEKAPSDESILITSAGVICSALQDNKKLIEFMKIITRYPLKDNTAEKYLREYLATPVTLIHLQLSGYISDFEVSAYKDFFDGNIDNTLNILLNDKIADKLAFDISLAVSKGLKVTAKPKYQLLNLLWDTKISSGWGNLYNTVILSSLRNYTIDDIIENTPTSLSEDYLNGIMAGYNIHNVEGIYDINKFIKLKDESKYVSKRSTFQGKPLIAGSKILIIAIVKHWLNKVDHELSKGLWSILSQRRIISVFYRYVQWSAAIGNDINKSRNNLAAYLVNFIIDKTVSTELKSECIENITEECAKYVNDNFANKVSPLKILFNFDYDLVKCIEDFNEDIEPIENIEAFQKSIELTK